MQVGSLVIAADLIGFVTGIDGKYTKIQGEDGRIHKVFSSQVHLIIEPYKLVLMLERKVCKVVK